MMWEFGLMFWLVPLLLFLLVRRSWCWAPAAGYREGRGESRSRKRHQGLEARHAPAVDDELEQQRGYIEQLERQVADLEERLDFTERLLAGRAQAAQ
jgi:hypothetical protein